MSRWTNTLRAAVRSRDGHEPLLSALRRAAYTDDGKLLFVNAGVDPKRPLTAQTDAFWWGSRALDTLAGPYNGFVRIVRGADPRQRGVAINDTLASLDGGCGSGGPLVAACFDAAGALLEMIET